MSGHSKWAQIKHRKAAADQKKGQLFTKLSREVAIAAKNGGDPETNYKLRLSLERAKDAGMSKEAIERATRRSSGEGKEQIEEVLYEGYAPGGIAFLIEAATSNRNRTTSEIRHILSKFEGSLGSQGSVAFLFSKKGQILIPREGNPNLEDISLAAIDAGAEDVKMSGEGLEIYTVPLDLEKVKNALFDRGVKIASCEVAQIPQTPIEPAEAIKDKILKLIETLEDNEDVIAVHTNASL